MVGKTIKMIRPLTKGEMESFYWEDRSEVPFLVRFDDDSWFIPMSDDEGNGPGALMYNGRIG